MNSLVESAKSDDVPEIVAIVLEQAYKFHAGGRIDDQTYHQQLERLEREELLPRGLALGVEEGPDGSARFVIRYGKSGQVCRELACRPHPSPRCSVSENGKLPPPASFFPPGIQPAC